jgi:hypothetical protein
VTKFAPYQGLVGLVNPTVDYTQPQNSLIPMQMIQAYRAGNPFVNPVYSRPAQFLPNGHPSGFGAQQLARPSVMAPAVQSPSGNPLSSILDNAGPGVGATDGGGGGGGGGGGK